MRAGATAGTAVATGDLEGWKEYEGMPDSAEPVKRDIAGTDLTPPDCVHF